MTTNDSDLAVQLRAEGAQLREELAYWKTCANCGQPMDTPGLCSVAKHEWQVGSELMYQETLTRAENAEAQLAAVEAEQTSLREQLSELKDYYARWDGKLCRCETCDTCRTFAAKLRAVLTRPVSSQEGRAPTT